MRKRFWNSRIMECWDRFSHYSLPVRQAGIIPTFLLFSSCAQIVSPTGGPQDTTPPKILKYEPDSLPVNFSSKTIRLKFNEYIQLKELSSQLVISPPMKQQPEINVRGKDLVIEIKDTLKKNTTYTFNFGNAITDITEGNAIEDFQYVFSTGPVIDSLSLSGVVKNAFTLSPEKGVLVMLYDTYDDSVPLKHTPTYFTKTKPDGSFKINYLRAGKYKIFAVKDANSNYLYDTPDEMIAFKDSLIDIPSTKKVEMLLFKEERKKQFVKSAKAVGYGHVKVVFNKPNPIMGFQIINVLGKEDKFGVVQSNNTNDSMDFFIPDYDQDSIRIIISDDLVAIDTVELKMPKKKSEDVLKPLDGSGQNKIQSINTPYVIKFNQQIGKLKILVDSKPYIVVLKGKDGVEVNDIYVRSQLNRMEIYPNVDLSKNWEENQEYRGCVLPGSVEDIFKSTNSDTIKFSFKTFEQKYYGSFKLNLKTENKNEKVLQLIGPSIEEDSLNGSKVLDYQFLNPGNYSLRLINDDNKNKKWTTGNYFKHQQPEKVKYYPNPITIRSNWDLELEWKVE